MKKILYLTLATIICSSIWNGAVAQEDKAVTESLKKKYSFIYWDNETQHYKNRDGDYWCLCDSKGKEIFRTKCQSIRKAIDKESFRDKNGKDLNYWIVHSLDDGKYGEFDSKYGVFDSEGKEIFPCKYSTINPLVVFYPEVKNKNNDWLISIGEKNGIADVKGREIIAPKFKLIEPLQNYYITYGDDFKQGLYDNNGREILSPKYNAINYIAEGLVGINEDGKWGYVDLSTGKIIIEPQYSKAEKFESGMAMVSKDENSFLISNPLKSGGSKTLASLSTKAGQAKSAIDANIPVVANRHNNETFVFIVANENYQDIHVPFAINDGSIFKEYCIKTLGIPEKNIRFEEDATVGSMRSIIRRMEEIADAFDGDAKLIFYYAGQGASDDKTNQAYLLPTDGSANNITSTGYSIAQLNKELGALNVKSAIVFLDACFNGAKRDGKMLAAARGVAVKVKNNVAQGNVVVFNAASADQSAQQYQEQGHGLFTYYLLKKLQESKGDVTLKALGDYVISNVKQQSVLSGKKSQTPVIITSDKLTQKWQNIKL